MIVGIGTDIIEISRVANALKKLGTPFLERLFTEKEREYFRVQKGNVQTISGNFAAKEAVVKAMGTGISGFKWKDVEINRDQKGKPEVFLYNTAKEIAGESGIGRIVVSISHCKEYAIAYAVASTDKGGLQRQITDDRYE